MFIVYPPSLECRVDEVTQLMLCRVCRVGQDRIYVPCTTVYWVISLP